MRRREIPRQGLAVEFDVEDLEKLRAIALREDLSIGHLVRRAVRMWLDRQNIPKSPSPKRTDPR